MSYVRITDLPELLIEDAIGDEYLFVTNVNIESNKIKLDSLTSFVQNNIVENLNQSFDSKLEVAMEEAVQIAVQESSQNNKIAVFDEGLQIGLTNKINFIGATVNSFLSEDETSIDVYIPSVTLSSNFNTNNGNSNAIIQNVAYSERYISSPTLDGSPFKIGDWAPGTLQKCIKTNVNYSTPEKFLVEKNSQMKLTISQGDTIVDQLQFIINNGSFTSNFITATISAKTKELSHFNCLFNCSFNLVNSIKGRFKIKIEYLGSNTFSFNENELFFDNDPVQADISMVNSFINNSYNYLSGIKYLSNLTKISSDITLLNSKMYTYPLNLVDIDGSLSGFSNQTIKSTDVINIDLRHNSNVVFNKQFSFLANKFFNGDLTLKSRINDWSTGTYKEFKLRGLVNTLTDNSTRIFEDFNTETLRLNNNLNGFDSTQDLNSMYLQVYNSKLVYPQLNFSEFYSNPNYSTKTGTRTYIRKFWHTNVSHSNGIFQISSNITEADLLNENVKIEISLDGVNWFNCNKDYIGGTLINNSFCRINSDTNNLNINNKIEFTLGLNKFTDFSSNWGIYLKLTFKDNVKDKYIDNIQIINWN